MKITVILAATLKDRFNLTLRHIYEPVSFCSQAFKYLLESKKLVPMEVYVFAVRDIGALVILALILMR